MYKKTALRVFMDGIISHFQPLYGIDTIITI